MLNRFAVLPATKGDAVYLSANLRSADRAEVEAATGRAPYDVLLESLRLSQPDCMTILAWDGSRHIPIAIFGVAPSQHNPTRGVCWFLGTDRISEARVYILKHAVKWLDFFSRKYPNGLHNWMDARNDTHRRWAIAAGFKVYPTPDYTMNGHAFYYIHRPSPEVTA